MGALWLGQFAKCELTEPKVSTILGSTEKIRIIFERFTFALVSSP
jgi:hypothetical protein